MGLPFLVKWAKIHMMMGVSVMTKNGFTACHISGARASVRTKSRAKKLRL